ncbi:hypothetical protein GVO57_10950 [Sphingomonas changnyeongensis]|uniref:Putative DNA-binding domain-containing protein n=1 Tax=Sphingomonas changnyeongensis TaxID=2698679 RepID=A0A7Z2S6A1_9SPHN|nr:hypothetical protein GVO57_10950 [Sphingomonas changnyeongensis]
MTGLAALQRRFQAGLIAGDLSGLRDLVRAPAGLAVHAHAARAMLVDALADNHPKTLHWLGGESFTALALDYIALTPSCSWTLADYGADFAEYLARTCAADPEIGEIAAIDWALRCAFSAADPGSDDWARVPGLEWDRLSLMLAPGAALLPVTTNADEIWAAVPERPVTPGCLAKASRCLSRATGSSRCSAACRRARRGCWRCWPPAPPLARPASDAGRTREQSAAGLRAGSGSGWSSRAPDPHDCRTAKHCQVHHGKSDERAGRARGCCAQQQCIIAARQQPCAHHHQRTADDAAPGGLPAIPAQAKPAGQPARGQRTAQRRDHRQPRLTRRTGHPRDQPVQRLALDIDPGPAGQGDEQQPARQPHRGHQPEQPRAAGPGHQPDRGCGEHQPACGDQHQSGAARFGERSRWRHHPPAKPGPQRIADRHPQRQRHQMSLAIAQPPERPDQARPVHERADAEQHASADQRRTDGGAARQMVTHTQQPRGGQTDDRRRCHCGCKADDQPRIAPVEPLGHGDDAAGAAAMGREPDDKGSDQAEQGDDHAGRSGRWVMIRAARSNVR